MLCDDHEVILKLGIASFRVAPLQIGSVAVWAWNGWSGSGCWSGRFLWQKGVSEQFRRFRFLFRSGKTVPTVLNGSVFRFRLGW